MPPKRGVGLPLRRDFRHPAVYCVVIVVVVTVLGVKDLRKFLRFGSVLVKQIGEPDAPSLRIELVTLPARELPPEVTSSPPVVTPPPTLGRGRISPSDVVALVYSGDVPGESPQDRRKRWGVIQSTWGQQLTTIFVPDVMKPDRDAGLASSSGGDLALLLSSKVSEFPPEKKKFSMYQKAIRYAVDKHQPKWLFQVHDHTLVLPNNLLHFSSLFNHSAEWILGSLLKIEAATPRTWFVSEPAGYLLSQGSLSEADRAVGQG
jgi:hypothetical protein